MGIIEGKFNWEVWHCDLIAVGVLSSVFFLRVFYPNTLNLGIFNTILRKWRTIPTRSTLDTTTTEVISASTMSAPVSFGTANVYEIELAGLVAGEVVTVQYTNNRRPVKGNPACGIVMVSPKSSVRTSSKSPIRKKRREEEQASQGMRTKKGSNDKVPR